MQNLRIIFFIPLVIVAAVGIAAFAETTVNANPNTDGALVFASERAGAAGLYRVTLEGVETRLTRENYAATHPAWSPDGKLIAFNAREAGREEIFVMDADGSNVRQLTENAGNNYYPSWSPDSKQIAFASNRNGSFQVFVMQADGANVRPLTDGTKRAEKPAWSNDGSEIAIMLVEGNNAEVYAVRADASSMRRLTNHPANDFNPAWSPDDKRIAFNSSRAGDHEIFVMDWDGSNVRQLTNATGWSEKPAWSPDGTKIAFYSNRDGDADIYVMDADGENVTRLTTAKGFDAQPAWEPAIVTAQATVTAQAGTTPPVTPAPTGTPIAAPTALPMSLGEHPVYVLDVLNGRPMTELYGIDADSQKVISTFALRYTPEIAFSSHIAHAYILDTYFSRGTRGDSKSVLSVVDANTLEILADDIPVPDRLQYKVYPFGDRWFFVSPDGSYLFVAKYGRPDPGVLRMTVLDARTYEQVAEYPYPQCDDNRVQIMNDGRLLCVRGQDVMAIAPLTGDESPLFRIKAGTTHATIMSPDRERWFHLDKEGRVTTAELSATPPRVLVEGVELDLPAQREPGGEILTAIGSDGRIYVGLVATSGELFGTGLADLIQVYDTETWDLIGEIEPAAPIRYLAVSNDGSQLYTTSSEARTFTVYDTETLKELGSIRDFGITPSLIIVPK